LLLLVLLPLGCGPSGPKTNPVSGKVTMDNKPLANATVTFIPANLDPKTPALQASGRTDDQGNYSLKMDKDNREGAPEGSYKVSISVFDRGGPDRPARGQLVPEEYNHKTTLTFTVPAEGSKDANFELSSRPPRQ